MKKIDSLMPLDRIIKYIRSERKDLLLLMYLALGYGILSIATPIAVQALVSNITMGGSIQPLVVISAIMFILLVLSGLLFVLEDYVVEFIQRRLFVSTAFTVCKNVQGMNANVHDIANPVELTNRFLGISTLQKSAASLLTVGLIAMIQCVIGSLVLIFYSVYFFIIAVMVFICFWVIVGVLGRHATKTAIEESSAKYSTVAFLETIAGNLYLFKFFKGIHRAESLVQSITSKYLEKRELHFKYLLRQNFTGAMAYALIGVIMLALGGMLVIKGQISLGQFVAAELIFFGILASFIRLLSKLEDYYDILAAVDKIGVLEDLPQEPNKIDEVKIENLNSLNVSKVNFGYSPELLIVQNVNFFLKKGESIAITGSSGSGKSTLVNLIASLRTPNNGVIEYDGIDLRQINQHSLRNLIGIAAKVEVLEGSILENIRLHDDSISIHQINEALSDMGLLDDIVSLKKGLSTRLNYFGAPLSNVQLELLMLVRAIVTKPDLLIIDGLIDSLNDIQLKTVIDCLQKRQKDWMLMITTRSTDTAKFFNQQLLLSDQKVD